MDVSGPAPFGAQARLAAQMPARTPPEVPVVDKSHNTNRTQGDTNTDRRDEDNAQAARDMHKMRDARRDPDVQTGPPPAFEVTLLEVEQDLQATLARLEAARNHDCDVGAVRTDNDSAEGIVGDLAADAIPTRSTAHKPPEQSGAQAGPQRETQIAGRSDAQPRDPPDENAPNTA